MTDYTPEDRHCPECGESFGFPADDVDAVAQAGFRASTMHDWSEITERGREAWRHVAHRQLSALADAGKLRNGLSVSEVMAFEAGVEEGRREAGRLLPEDTRWPTALHAEADRVHALGGDYNEAVAVGLRAAARMISEDAPEDARTEYGWDCGKAGESCVHHILDRDRAVSMSKRRGGVAVQRSLGPWVPVPEEER